MRKKVRVPDKNSPLRKETRERVFKYETRTKGRKNASEILNENKRD